MRVVIQACFQAVLHTSLNYENRLNWDEDFYDFKEFYRSPCKARRRLYYTLKFPASVSDRDFYLNEHTIADYPEPGMFSIFLESMVPNEAEMPKHKNRVRVNLHGFGAVLKPFFDTMLNKEITEIFFVS